MKVLEIPFNKYLAIKEATQNNGFIFELEEKPEYLNHLKTIHASALFALSEATSGECLLKHFKSYKLDVVPVVRKVENKYSKPVNGIVRSKAKVLIDNTDAFVAELRQKKRAIVQVKVDLYNSDNKIVMSSIFDWFIAFNE